jgi:hypothetical protein
MTEFKYNGPDVQILNLYREMIAERHSAMLQVWPLLSGKNSKIGHYKGWTIVIMEQTGITSLSRMSNLQELSEALIGVSELTNLNKNASRQRLESHYNLKPTDAVVFVDSNGSLFDELELMLQKHEHAVGMTPMKIFLSHKGADKTLIREYKRTLATLGFDPWLDEDAMSAGTELERGILQGFKDSCAAVFFVTPSFTDENFLATEVNYAIAERRKKVAKFSIITLVFTIDGAKGVVPDLLRPYVWKEPTNDLEAMREIIHALPVRLGDVYWK